MLEHLKLVEGECEGRNEADCTAYDEPNGEGERVFRLRGVGHTRIIARRKSRLTGQACDNFM
jgi:hypothetical protein